MKAYHFLEAILLYYKLCRYVTEESEEGGVYAQRKPLVCEECVRVSGVRDQQVVCALSLNPIWASKTCLEIQRLPRNMTRDLKQHIVASDFNKDKAEEIQFCGRP